VSAALAESLASELSKDSRSPHETLSDREFEVMQLLLAGRSLKEIAVELSLSPKTVSTFHTRIWEKLRVRSDVELVRYAQKHGMRDG
jgi:DNA-binding NarL/FixJ family response regulator